ncbi:hypothetical protein MTO96_020608 [Rhipicephalus appendiculatus]
MTRHPSQPQVECAPWIMACCSCHSSACHVTRAGCDRTSPAARAYLHSAACSRKCGFSVGGAHKLASREAVTGLGAILGGASSAPREGQRRDRPPRVVPRRDRDPGTASPAPARDSLGARKRSTREDDSATGSLQGQGIADVRGLRVECARAPHVKCGIRIAAPTVAGTRTLAASALSLRVVGPRAPHWVADGRGRGRCGVPADGCAFVAASGLSRERARGPGRRPRRLCHGWPKKPAGRSRVALA